MSGRRLEFHPGYHRGDLVVVALERPGSTPKPRTRVCQLHDTSDMDPALLVGASYAVSGDTWRPCWIDPAHILGLAGEDRRARAARRSLARLAQLRDAVRDRRSFAHAQVRS